MMELQKARKWHLVRNDNGEWISSGQVEMLDESSAMIYCIEARRHGLPLFPQTGYDGETWCYKHELEAVKAAIRAHPVEMPQRQLKVQKRKGLTEEEKSKLNPYLKNMLKPKTSGSFNALKEEFLLWGTLEKDPPEWWKNLMEDKELYVEIRKDNYANVYYYGGSVALVQWRVGRALVVTHHKYLGKDLPDGEYQDCTGLLQTPEGIGHIKEKVREEYHKLPVREKADEQKHLYTSNEKWVQGELKLRFPGRYIDSEFAYRWPEDSRKTIRMDLVELRGKELVCVELKLITDHRLRSRDGNPEIIGQMEDYRAFIAKHAEAIKDYYTKVLRLKKRLGLWNGEAEIEDLSPIPELLIVDTYKPGGLSKGKRERVEDIERLKERPGFKTTLIGYPDLCK